MFMLKEGKMTDKVKQDTLDMIVSYMDKGFLNNIIAMFKSEKDLYPLAADLIKDERLRVRMGITALMEELCESDKDHCQASVEPLLVLLKSNNPTLRGDAAYLLSLVGGKTVEIQLKPLLEDPHPQVREIVMDFFENANN